MRPAPAAAQGADVAKFSAKAQEAFAAANQVESFASELDSAAFMEGPHFRANPIGVEYDPGDSSRSFGRASRRHRS